MKNIKNMALSGALALLATAAFTACIEGNDWDVDSSYSRLFHVTQSSISVAAEATTAEVTFTKAPNTTNYLIQLSQDSLYDDMDESQARIITLGEDGSITTSPYVIKNLYGDTKYFFRMKGKNAQKNIESVWVYLKKGSFKTKAEQILAEITDADRDETFINVSWDSTLEVTHLIVSHLEEQEEESVSVDVRYDLDDEAKKTGTFKITGLTPMTAYTITIYNNEAVRGTRKASTAAPSPAGDYKFTFKAENGNMLEQLRAIAAQAEADGRTAYSVTAIIAGGDSALFVGANDSGEEANVKLPNGMSVTFFGGAGEVPTLVFKKCVDIEGSHKYVRFENLNIVNGGGGYFLNQSNASDVEELTVRDCRVTGFTDKTFLRIQGSGVTVGEINLKNSVFTDCAKSYAFLDLRNGTTKAIEVDSCTFDSICVTGKCFIQSTGKDYDKIVISNSTFYNICGNGQYFIDLAADKNATQFEINNCIFGKTADQATNKNTRSAEKPVVTNSYSATDWYKVIKGIESTGLRSDELFVDPANGDFHFKTGVNELYQVGDPRWFSVVE